MRSGIQEVQVLAAVFFFLEHIRQWLKQKIKSALKSWMLPLLVCCVVVFGSREWSTLCNAMHHQKKRRQRTQSDADLLQKKTFFGTIVTNNSFAQAGVLISNSRFEIRRTIDQVKVAYAGLSINRCDCWN